MIYSCPVISCSPVVDCSELPAGSVDETPVDSEVVKGEDPVVMRGGEVVRGEVVRGEVVRGDVVIGEVVTAPEVISPEVAQSGFPVVIPTGKPTSEYDTK